MTLVNNERVIRSELQELPAEETIARVTEVMTHPQRTRRGTLAFRVCVLCAMGMMMVLTLTLGYLFLKGIGILGNTMPSAWGIPIVNFVWWIGIGHAGTFISAILLILHQSWRNSINRFAEAMTLVAVACAALMPLIHLGRPIIFYWLIPYPNTMNLWPQFRSPLMWDMFAIGTYGLISLLFFIVGLIPDLATFRDTAQTKSGQLFYGMLAGGWKGSARHWSAHRLASKVLAGLATPLVVSVHSIVALDFAAAILPAWHSELFPPYFVAGAIYSGFAMVICISVILRKFCGFGRYITDSHVDKMVFVMMGTGLIVAYAYIVEVYLAWYVGKSAELNLLADHLYGQSAVVYWSVIACNIIIPQVLWFKFARRNAGILFAMGIVINLGMWLERYLIVTGGLNRGNLPPSWGQFHMTVWDFGIIAGLLGFFVLSLMLFVRFFPAIPMFEIRSSVHHLEQIMRGEA